VISPPELMHAFSSGDKLNILLKIRKIDTRIITAERIIK
jgi:hypothetical protein